MSSLNTEEPKTNPLIAATTPGYRHHKSVPMLRFHEGKELRLPMIMLTGRETTEVKCKAYADTLKQFNGKVPKKDELSNWDEIYNYQHSYWTIFYSIRLPNDLTKKWFLSKEAVEEEYTWDEIDVLMANNLTVRVTQPHLINLDPTDPEAFQKAIDNIKKMGEESDFFLNGFTTHSVNQLIKYLVARLEN